jgi:hypothetical protein
MSLDCKVVSDLDFTQAVSVPLNLPAGVLSTGNIARSNGWESSGKGVERPIQNFAEWPMLSKVNMASFRGLQSVTTRCLT